MSNWTINGITCNLVIIKDSLNFISKCIDLQSTLFKMLLKWMSKIGCLIEWSLNGFESFWIILHLWIGQINGLVTNQLQLYDKGRVLHMHSIWASNFLRKITAIVLLIFQKWEVKTHWMKISSRFLLQVNP